MSINNGLCLCFLSPDVIKYHDQKQLREARVYFAVGSRGEKSHNSWGGEGMAGEQGQEAS